ncbi:MAG: hypothetical protein HQM13_00845 [SAR324 cluster bacterium]|nr:hypothetical protein [SAR324 cluster bacterium]
MKVLFSYLKWGLFFSSAVLFVLAVQWVRQQPPMPTQEGWPYQVVESLDQAGDLFHALKALPRALNDPQSRQAALKFQNAIVQRKAKAPSALHQLDQEIMGTERRYKVPRLIFSKGVIADLEQNDQEALHWYQKAIEMKPGMSIGYVHQALVYERLGALAKAAESFQKALVLDKNAPLSHFHHGLFWARSTDQQEKALAEADFLEEIRPVYAKIIRDTLEQKELFANF